MNAFLYSSCFVFSSCINFVPSLPFSCSCVWLPWMENEELNQDPRETLKNRAVTINSFLPRPAESAGSLHSFPMQALLTDDLGLIRTGLDLTQMGKTI